MKNYNDLQLQFEGIARRISSNSQDHKEMKISVAAAKDCIHSLISEQSQFIPPVDDIDGQQFQWQESMQIIKYPACPDCDSKHIDI